jgi:hypothetical protein
MRDAETSAALPAAINTDADATILTIETGHSHHMSADQSPPILKINSAPIFVLTSSLAKFRCQ